MSGTRVSARNAARLVHDEEIPVAAEARNKGDVSTFTGNTRYAEGNNASLANRDI